MALRNTELLGFLTRLAEASPPLEPWVSGMVASLIKGLAGKSAVSPPAALFGGMRGPSRLPRALSSPYRGVAAASAAAASSASPLVALSPAPAPAPGAAPSPARSAQPAAAPPSASPPPASSLAHPRCDDALGPAQSEAEAFREALSSMLHTFDVFLQRSTRGAISLRSKGRRGLRVFG